MIEKASTVRLILGDQLNRHHSWFKQVDKDCLYVMMECRSETDYVVHHIQKVVGFFLSMRAFAKQLIEDGHRVLYLSLDDSDNQQDIIKNLHWILEESSAQTFAYQLPDEYRLDQALSSFSQELNIKVEVVDTEHFYTKRDQLEKQFTGKKTYLMEAFYRKIRTQYQIMMEVDGKTPLTGRWNYDSENRKKLPKGQEIPNHFLFEHDATEIVALLEKEGVKTMGEIENNAFPYPITEEESEQLLEEFLHYRLANFGRFQDALSQEDDFLFHSRLSFAMNTKMLAPQRVVNATIEHWEQNQESIDIAQVEGFVRQIIGWREFMRGIYWAQMPGYAQKNFFQAEAKLPDWYWTGDTKLSCLRHAIKQSLEKAYAHHIQRLMVTGNFALMLGVNPDEVDRWYLGIYIDAIEWVEITNTRGMSQFADGGLLATKPYCSSANYIHQMSDYCKNCHYDRKIRHGEKACPFNSLYWDFMDRHRDKLERNPRIGMVYRSWDRMDVNEREKTLEQAHYYKQHADLL